MIALWLLAGCSAPDPALGEWLCAERWDPAGWQGCPVDGTTWQISLGPEDATFYSVDVASAAFEGRDLLAVSVDEGAWTLTEVVDVPDGQGLVLHCALDQEVLACAGSDDEATWSLRLVRP